MSTVDLNLSRDFRTICTGVLARQVRTSSRQRSFRPRTHGIPPSGTARFFHWVLKCPELTGEADAVAPTFPTNCGYGLPTPGTSGCRLFEESGLALTEAKTGSRRQFYARRSCKTPGDHPVHRHKDGDKLLPVERLDCDINGGAFRACGKRFKSEVYSYSASTSDVVLGTRRLLPQTRETLSQAL